MVQKLIKRRRTAYLHLWWPNQKALWKQFRSMKQYTVDLASDDVIHEKVQERRRRLVINMYVDSFMASWNLDNLKKSINFVL